MVAIEAGDHTTTKKVLCPGCKKRKSRYLMKSFRGKWWFTFGAALHCYLCRIGVTGPAADRDKYPDFPRPFPDTPKQAWTPKTPPPPAPRKDDSQQ